MEVREHIKIDNLISAYVSLHRERDPSTVEIVENLEFYLPIYISAAPIEGITIKQSHTGDRQSKALEGMAGRAFAGMGYHR